MNGIAHTLAELAEQLSLPLHDAEQLEELGVIAADGDRRYDTELNARRATIYRGRELRAAAADLNAIIEQLDAPLRELREAATAEDRRALLPKVGPLIGKFVLAIHLVRLCLSPEHPAAPFSRALAMAAEAMVSEFMLTTDLAGLGD